MVKLMVLLEMTVVVMMLQIVEVMNTVFIIINVCVHMHIIMEVLVIRWLRLLMPHIVTIITSEHVE